MITRSRKLTWASLASEIRVMILKAIADQKNPGWASLASVCKEWQYYLERANFSKIKLRVSCLDDFERIVSPQKRALVHHICLNIELPRYSSGCCSKRRSPPEKERFFFRDGIWKLFSILSTWGPADNLALEINAYSSSDRVHWFRNIYLSSDNTEDDEGAISDASRTGILRHDPRHGWMNGQQVRAPPRSAVERLFQPIPSFSKSLPQVTVVTCLIIRRQLRRYLPPSSIADLFTSLDRLEYISWEPWVPQHYQYQLTKQDLLFFALRMYNALRTLNKLVIFEDSPEFYYPFPARPLSLPLGPYHDFGEWRAVVFASKSQDLQHLPLNPLLDPSEWLAAIFASKSQDLQHLAISFMIDAGNFLRYCRPTWSWSRLQSLALTSQFLQDGLENRKKIEVLLRQAGDLVQKMPKMHTFVLWNGGRGHACAFIYRVDRDRASITWRGTWHLELSPAVVKSWQPAAEKLPISELQVKHECIREVVRSHGDAIYYLQLPCQVIEPASLWQIRRE